MNLKCGYFTVGGIMCGSLVGIFVGALAVNASLGYMILLLGAWGLCLYITSRSLMDDARREEAVLNQPAEEFDDPDELPPLYWEGYDRGYEDALESMCPRFSLADFRRWLLPMTVLLSLKRCWKLLPLWWRKRTRPESLPPKRDSKSTPPSMPTSARGLPPVSRHECMGITHHRHGGREQLCDPLGFSRRTGCTGCAD